MRRNSILRSKAKCTAEESTESQTDHEEIMVTLCSFDTYLPGYTDVHHNAFY